MATPVTVPVVSERRDIRAVKWGRSRHDSIQRSNPVLDAGGESGAGSGEWRSVDGGAGLGGDAFDGANHNLSINTPNPR